MRYGDGSTPKRKKRVRMNVEAGKSVVGKDSSTEDEDEDDDLCVRDTSTTPKRRKRARMIGKAVKSVAGRSTDDEEKDDNVRWVERSRRAIRTRPNAAAMLTPSLMQCRRANFYHFQFYL